MLCLSYIDVNKRMQLPYSCTEGTSEAKFSVFLSDQIGCGPDWPPVISAKRRRYMAASREV